MAGVLLPMRRFHPMDRDTDLLLPLSVQDWLSKGHLHATWSRGWKAWI
jgi:hypothetical protein